MKRIKSKVENYMSYSQSACRANISTTVIKWPHQFIIAKVMLYQNMDVQIMGVVDMSSAFDTIEREELMQALELILKEDEIRMCRLLLTETSTTLWFGKDFTESFETNKGSAQGDAISDVFFNIAFESALRNLRSELNKTNPNIEQSYSKVSSLPIEMLYTDGSDLKQWNKYQS